MGPLEARHDPRIMTVATVLSPPTAPLLCLLKLVRDAAAHRFSSTLQSAGLGLGLTTTIK